MKTKFVPNTVLPRGGALVTPFKREIGGYVEMEFDATCTRLGLTWYRVKGGFSEKGDREDWVADLPAGCLSIHDYNFVKGNFGEFHGSFDGAILAETKRALRYATDKATELREQAQKQEEAVAMLSASLRNTSSS